MISILKELDLEEVIPNFMEQKVTPDIVCQITEKEFESLGLTSRNKIMELRTTCVTYGSYSPPQPVSPLVISPQFSNPSCLAPIVPPPHPSRFAPTPIMMAR